jgi:hypothetical protein
MSSPEERLRLNFKCSRLNNKWKLRMLLNLRRQDFLMKMPVLNLRNNNKKLFKLKLLFKPSKLPMRKLKRKLQRRKLLRRRRLLNRRQLKRRPRSSNRRSSKPRKRRQKNSSSPRRRKRRPKP